MRRLAALFVFSLVTMSPTLALADLTLPKDDEPTPPKQKSCSASYQDDAILGLAALALLVSGVALRRRDRSDAQPASP